MEVKAHNNIGTLWKLRSLFERELLCTLEQTKRCKDVSHSILKPYLIQSLSSLVNIGCSRINAGSTVAGKNASSARSVYYNWRESHHKDPMHNPLIQQQSEYMYSKQGTDRPFDSLESGWLAARERLSPNILIRQWMARLYQTPRSPSVYRE